ncbi:MAG: transposase [Planctomycetes bacterium]|nr:transposase [Planctomycetota bacterium]
MRFTDAERARLARAGKALGRKLLSQYATIATPATILRWHRQIVAAKWTFQRMRTGRPKVMEEIEGLIVTMARANPGWGYDRVQGALANLGHRVAASTVAAVLARNGIPPAPRRRTTWAQFVKAHKATLAAADFFTVEVWSWCGLRTIYVLFAIRLATRRVETLGVTPNPDSAFMAQIARNVTSETSPVFDGVSHLLIDRGAKYTEHFREILQGSGIGIVHTPPKCPQANGVAERFVGTARREVLDRLVFFGIGSLNRALREFVDFHYRHERNHQGLGNRIIEPKPGVGAIGGEATRRERLGGLPKYYYRAVA